MLDFDFALFNTKGSSCAPRWLCMPSQGNDDSIVEVPPTQWVDPDEYALEKRRDTPSRRARLCAKSLRSNATIATENGSEHYVRRSHVPQQPERSRGNSRALSTFPCADDVELPQTLLQLVSASAARQHPVKRQHGLIDADATEETSTFLGVCDGASEVQRMGIPPDALPRELLRHCRRAHEYRLTQKRLDRNGDWIVDLIEDSFNSTHALGATTLLLACLDETNRLVVANIGNSCLLLLRPSQQTGCLELCFKTDVRTSSCCFDGDLRRPKQLMRLHGVHEEDVQTLIQEAAIASLELRHGDLLILGSDGLFQNLQDREIVRIVSQVVAKEACSIYGGGDPDDALPRVPQLKEAADMLVTAAIESVPLGAGRTDLENISPNGVPAPDAKAKKCGHPDDTTAIVALVIDHGKAAARQRAALPANKSFLAMFDDSASLSSPSKQANAVGTESGKVSGKVGREAAAMPSTPGPGGTGRHPLRPSVPSDNILQSRGESRYLENTAFCSAASAAFSGVAASGSIGNNDLHGSLASLDVSRLAMGYR